MSTNHYLELSENPIRFEPVNQLTNVFFDDSNKHVFAVRSGGVMGVVVKGPNETDKCLNFRMEDHGSVLSIKFSLDLRTLAVQRCNNSVEFMNFNDGNLETEYSQSCKKNSVILGFVWTQFNEVAIITDHGIELYLVIFEKNSLKYLKMTSMTIQWFVWCSRNKIALIASSHGCHLQPALFKPGSVSKLAKLEIEPGRMALERDVTLSTLYNIPAVLILRHQSGPQSAEVHVYMLSGPGQAPIKSHILKLGLSGRFAINIVDDLILVHHQASRSSQIFDISLPGDSDGSLKYHTTVAPPQSFKTAVINLPGLVEPQTHICELYSPNWVVFQPNIVIDAKLGCLWHIKLQLSELCAVIPNILTCTQVALKRTDGKAILLKLLLDTIRQAHPPLDELQACFSQINAIYLSTLEAELQSHTASPPNAPLQLKTQTRARVVIDQFDMYSAIFQQLDADPSNLAQLQWSLTSYMTSLFELGIQAQHNLNELLITTLVKRRKLTTLQQMLDYGVISDSKPLACLLLSLGNLHPAASQVALDMLARLNAIDEMQEILLSDGRVLSALKLAMENANPRKFLQMALATGDDLLFHTVLYHFRNNSNFSAAFAKDERLNYFISQYDTKFVT